MKDEKIKIFIQEAMKFAPDFRKNFITPQVTSGLKLSPHQFFCLINIFKSGNLTMSELAIKLGVSNQQITRIMDGLVKNDLVVRYADTTNRRVVMTKISPQGMKVLEDFQLEMQKNVARSLETLTTEEVDQCITHLRELNAILSKTKQSFFCAKP